MIANLFIDKHSFECEETDVVQFKKLLKSFSEMVSFASNPEKGGENDFYLNKSDFLKTIVFQDVTVEDLLYCTSDKVRNLIGSDVSILFASAFKTFKKLRCNKPITRLPIVTKERTYAICVMLHTQNLPSDSQIIANIRDLGKFRCHHFIKFADSNGYFEEADRYMTRLRLHPDIKNEYKKVFNTHMVKIDKCLWTLDESYLSYQTAYVGSRVCCVADFAKANNIYDGGSYEGSKKFKRKKLRFEDREDEVYCEPHLKMNKDDNGNKGYCRIYFEEPRQGAKRVYICHICEHK